MATKKKTGAAAASAADVESALATTSIPEVPAEAGFRIQATSIVASAKALCAAGILTEQDFITSTALMEANKGLKEEVAEFFKPTKTKAHDLHKTIVAQEKAFLAPLEETEKALKTARLDYAKKNQPPVAMVKRETWAAKVTDLKALVAGVASGKYPLEFIQANMPTLNIYAKAMKDAGAVDGVVFEKTEGEAF